MNALAANDSNTTPETLSISRAYPSHGPDDSISGVGDADEAPLSAADDEFVVVDADGAPPDHDAIVVEQRADAPMDFLPPLPQMFQQPEDHEDALPEQDPDAPDASDTHSQVDPDSDTAIPAAQPDPSDPPDLPTAVDDQDDPSPSETPPRYNTRSRGPISPAQHRTDLTLGAGGGRLLKGDSNIFHISVKQAFKDPNLAGPAREAIDKELSQMLTKGVFTPVHESQMEGLKKPIRSHFFLKEKYNADGSFLLLRGRLVANGNNQPRPDVPDEDISSPTAAMPFLFAVAAIAAKEGRQVVTADVPVAYLNADNSRHNISMVLDPDTATAIIRLDPSYAPYRRSDRTIVVRLNRAIYGCIESARLWYDLLRDTLEKIGFQVNPLDPCILNRSVDGVQCTVVVYVDDLKFTCSRRELIDEAIATLEARFESKLKVTEGEIHSYLGMRWDYSAPGKCVVTMDGYTSDVLADSGVDGVSDTPAANHLFAVRPDADPLTPEQREEFHTLVAKLLYLAKRVRPDVLLPVSFLATRVHGPDQDDLKKLRRILRYLKGTYQLGIVLEAEEGPLVKAYIDASYGVHSDCRSHSGMVITMGGAPIDTKSVKQRINTKSSAEAELIALSDMASRAIWCREFLLAQGYAIAPARVFQDNMSTMALATKGTSSSDRTRHVSIRYFWMKDRVDTGDIEVVYKPTADMIADILTKPLQGEQFMRLRNLLLNWTC
jgi:histone deacetylase 1/2